MKYILSLMFFLSTATATYAQPAIPIDQYVIRSFDSEITLKKDRSLFIKETVVVNFPDKRHGIYRIIPVRYTYKGKTIDSRLAVVSIKNANGEDLEFEKSRLRQSIQLKIGSPDIYVSGEKTYVITYTVKNILQRYGDLDEVYWNVTGSEWDTDILKSKAKFVSEHAVITETTCFTGKVGFSEKDCLSKVGDSEAVFESETEIEPRDDFTIAVRISDDNLLSNPGVLQYLYELLYANWGYLVAFVPLFVMFYFWWKRGRDTRYVSENIYYKPDEGGTRTVMPFERKHLPLVYHPIDGMSPSEVGTLVDEKVDIEDVVAEMLELARLRCIGIRKIEKDKFFGKETDYVLFKEVKQSVDCQATLSDYQVYLLQEIFSSTSVSNSKKKYEKLNKNNSLKNNELSNIVKTKEYVLMSALKNNFYKSLADFKKKLYDRMQKEGYFYSDPQKTREKWMGLSMVIIVFSWFSLFYFQSLTYNFIPYFVLLPMSVAALLFAWKMPKRTAKGYSYYRQIEGLRWYLKKGKWRHEISEKRLFIEEVLPLAVTLGVVDKLVKDMKELGIKPPSYFGGTTSANFSSDLLAFRDTSTSSMLSAPSGKSSGMSSWGGGSGFSGGSSGGGFGGGGGGSW